jgi:hypothetical protein
MADVPVGDAGLGSGIVNLSQQVAGALGLAVLGTIATNHSKALEARGHTLASSLVSGYHLAFTIGAGSILVGILTTLVVLRPLHGRAAVTNAADSQPARLSRGEPDRQLDRQAA